MTDDAQHAARKQARTEYYRLVRQAFEGYSADPDRWWLVRRELPDGRTLWLQPMLYGNLRISVGPGEGLIFDDNWCYHDRAEAFRQAFNWNGEGEPDGWVRHIETGRRRPDGDAEREFVRR